jgi:hypothetical protein
MHRNPDPMPGIQQQARQGLALAAAYESQEKNIANLGIHTQRLSRYYQRTAAELRDLQETRIKQEKIDLSDLADIIEMKRSKGETYSPRKDGFVFSLSQIKAAIRAKRREKLAHEAFTFDADEEAA